ncbi:MAG: hypothetical protein HOV83_15355, partial [Catenulispora sp.]|nr:hypothetical protein [Catenulispora sp.]
MKLQPRSRRTSKRTFAFLLAPALGIALAGTAAAATPTFPTYTLDTTRSLNSTLRGDIAGSAFVGADGQFHWLNSYATYATSDTGSYTNTFTNTDLGALNAQIGSGTTEVSADTYYDRPGSLCYQTDKDPVHPAPSPYEDDHCDVVGVWVDPDTGTWYGVVNDEYDFAPWATNNPTVVQRIQTGVHGNRILAASSTDQGQTWTFGGEIVTSPFTDHDAFDATAAPGPKTWNYGVAGTRLFIDYPTGYFYLVYNTQVKTKPGLTTVAAWNTLARAPISGKMAPGTWNKFSNGTWTQPGIAGTDGTVQNPLGLVASYTPAADRVDFTGKGADGKAVDFRTVWPSSNVFSFTDAAGASYSANTSTGVITDAGGATVAAVTYQDPALAGSVTVATTSSKVVITVTDANGLATVQTVSNNVLEDTTTHRLYVSPPVNESAITLNVYSSNSYLSVGYDKYVYQSSDLGAANTWNVVGAEPSGASSSYLTSLDYGSLTNQNVSSRSYRTISSLSGGMWDVSATPHSAGQTHFLVGKAPSDSCGAAVSSASTYGL